MALASLQHFVAVALVRRRPGSRTLVFVRSSEIEVYQPPCKLGELYKRLSANLTQNLGAATVPPDSVFNRLGRSVAPEMGSLSRYRNESVQFD